MLPSGTIRSELLRECRALGIEPLDIALVGRWYLCACLSGRQAGCRGDKREKKQGVAVHMSGNAEDALA